MSTQEASAARRRVFWAVRGLGFVTSGPQEPLRELAWVALAQRNLVDAAADYVDAARRGGASWAAVGEALGISRQSAQRAYQTRTRRLVRLRDDLVWFPGGVPAKYASNAKEGMRRRSVEPSVRPVDGSPGRSGDGGSGRSPSPRTPPAGDRCGLPVGHPIWHPQCRCPVKELA